MTRGRTPQDGYTPLHVAAGYGKEAMVKLLVEAGSDTEATEKVRVLGERRGHGKSERPLPS